MTRGPIKVAWFQGDAQAPESLDYGPAPDTCQDDIMERAEKGDPRTPTLRVLLVPSNVSLTDLGGDDWNDAPADCNASEPYNPPDGSVWVELRLGDAWPKAAA